VGDDDDGSASVHLEIDTSKRRQLESVVTMPPPNMPAAVTCVGRRPRLRPTEAGWLVGRSAHFRSDSGRGNTGGSGGGVGRGARGSRRGRRETVPKQVTRPLWVINQLLPNNYVNRGFYFYFIFLNFFFVHTLLRKSSVHYSNRQRNHTVPSNLILHS
jgi:hypothetical protein